MSPGAPSESSNSLGLWSSVFFSTDVRAQWLGKPVKWRWITRMSRSSRPRWREKEDSVIKTLGGYLESVCKGLPARSRPSCRHCILEHCSERLHLHRCFPWSSSKDRRLTALGHDEDTPLPESSLDLPGRTDEACERRHQRTLDIDKGSIHDTSQLLDYARRLETGGAKWAIQLPLLVCLP